MMPEIARVHGLQSPSGMLGAGEWLLFGLAMVALAIAVWWLR